MVSYDLDRFPMVFARFRPVRGTGERANGRANPPEHKPGKLGWDFLCVSRFGVRGQGDPGGPEDRCRNEASIDGRIPVARVSRGFRGRQNPEAIKAPNIE